LLCAAAPVSDERVHCNAAGHVELKSETQGHGSTTHLGRSRWGHAAAGSLLMPRDDFPKDCFAAVNYSSEISALGRLPAYANSG